MSEETPNNRADELLRRHAKGRREQVPDMSLHPATRRLLQGEVARQLGRGGDERRGWVSSMSALLATWPRRIVLAGGTIAVVLIATFVALDLNAPRGEQRLAQAPTPYEPQLESLRIVEDEFRRDAAPSVAFQNTSVITNAAGAGTTAHFYALSSATEPAMRDGLKPGISGGNIDALRSLREPHVANLGRSELETLNGVAQTGAADSQGRAIGYGFERADLQAGRAPDAPVQEPSVGVRLDDTSAADKGAAATLGPLAYNAPRTKDDTDRYADTLAAQPPELSVLLKKEAESGKALSARESLGDATTAAAVPEAALKAKTGTLNESIAAAPVETSVALAGGAVNPYFKQIAPVRQAQRFYRVQEPLPGAVNGGTDNAVLANFAIEQTNGTIRVVDSDASVYVGQVGASEAFGAESLARSESARDESRLKDGRPGEAASRRLSFRASGTNRSSGKLVVLTGSFDESPQVQSMATRALERDSRLGATAAPAAPSPARGQGPAPVSRARRGEEASQHPASEVAAVARTNVVAIEGTLRVGSAPERPFRAMQAGQ